MVAREGITVVTTPPRAPWAHCDAERWVPTVRAGCTGRMLIYGEAHLRAVRRACAGHDNGPRRHQASIWGWDETTSSLYAHLWRNTNDPAEPLAIRIEPGEYTPPITWPGTLSQYMAMAVNLSPLTVDTIIGDMPEQDQDWAAEDRGRHPPAQALS